MTETSDSRYTLGMAAPEGPQAVLPRELGGLLVAARQAQAFLADERVRRAIQRGRIREVVQLARAAGLEQSPFWTAVIRLVRAAALAARLVRRPRVGVLRSLVITSGRALRGPTAFVAPFPATGLLALHS